MNLIQKLPVGVANKIAAGEVVERPSAVVKELIENSIDAGSQHIDIYIIEGGKERIQVVDDGSGMSQEDAVMSLERFSTSKIFEFEDLEKLTTFGFRGEAVASIASVSLMEIKTKYDESREGVLVRCEGGDVIEVRSIPWNKGTSVTVNNLFFNTPARRKFQKNALSEARQIYRVFRYYALAYPELYLSLHHDGRCIWRLQPADLIQRISDVFDPKIRNNLIKVSFQNNLYSLFGYTSIPEWTRSTRNDQYLFINKRYIKNRTVEHGVYQGYGTTLGHSAGHPFFILMLTLPPDLYDINIHPSKLEAKFQDERGIHHLFSHAVRSCLGLTDMMDYSETAGKKNELSQGNSERFPEQHTSTAHTVERAPLELDFEGQRSKNDKGVSTDDSAIGEKLIDREKVWQVHNCYIFSQVKNGLIIIDQHVAHERILYEKALRRLEGGEKPSQQLLFPQAVQLDKDEIIILRELLPDLSKLGFGIKVSETDTILIESTPLEIKAGREINTLRNIFEEYQKDEYKDLSVYDRLAMSFACRSAIMKGDKLTVDEMYKLIDDLFATEFPYFCPHGRPTVIDFSLNDLNARFLR